MLLVSVGRSLSQGPCRDHAGPASVFSVYVGNALFEEPSLFHLGGGRARVFFGMLRRRLRSS